VLPAIATTNNTSLVDRPGTVTDTVSSHQCEEHMLPPIATTNNTSLTDGPETVADKVSSHRCEDHAPSHCHNQQYITY
jgi:hypothetical protein